MGGKPRNNTLETIAQRYSKTGSLSRRDKALAICAIIKRIMLPLHEDKTNGIKVLAYHVTARAILDLARENNVRVYGEAKNYIMGPMEWSSAHGINAQWVRNMVKRAGLI